MNTMLLVGAVVVVPFLWGWSVHWLLERLWPARDDASDAQTPPPPAQTNFLDFQI